MSRRLLVYCPPVSRGAGLLTHFVSLAEGIRGKGGIRCLVPAHLPIEFIKPPSLVTLERRKTHDDNSSGPMSPPDDEPDVLSFWEGQGAPLGVEKIAWEEVTHWILALVPTFPDVLETRRIRSELFQRGVNPERVHVCAWTSPGPHRLPVEWIEDQLGCRVYPMRWDEEPLLKAETSGRTLMQSAPRSRMVKDIERLAARLKQPAASASDGKPASSAHQSGADSMVIFERRTLERFWDQLEKEEGALVFDERSVETRLTRVMESVSLESSLDVAHEQWAALHLRLCRQILGWGPLEDMMADPETSEIMVNGPSEIYWERNGRLERSPARFAGDNQLKIVIDRMAGSAGRRVDTASPLCDVRLPDGSRVNVVLPPVSLNGPVITVRRFRSAFQRLEDLVEAGSLAPIDADRLIQAVKARMNIVIAGNSGSGKTTLLNLLSHYISDTDRVVTMEDAAELQLQKPHVVRLETRKTNIEGAGEVGMSDLVINALRMRPDRLIVGECRGPEVIPMLQAMNTGHDGSMATVHANSAEDALRRLESLVLLGAPQWTTEVARRLMASALDVIVFLKRTGTVRVLESVSRVQSDEDRIFLTPFNGIEDIR